MLYQVQTIARMSRNIPGICFGNIVFFVNLSVPLSKVHFNAPQYRLIFILNITVRGRYGSRSDFPKSMSLVYHNTAWSERRQQKALLGDARGVLRVAVLSFSPPAQDSKDDNFVASRCTIRMQRQIDAAASNDIRSVRTNVKWVL